MVSSSDGPRNIESRGRPLSAWWLFPYLVGLAVASYFGDFGSGAILGGVGPFKGVLVGGHGAIPLWWDMCCLTVLSLSVYIGAMAQRGRAAAPRANATPANWSPACPRTGVSGAPPMGLTARRSDVAPKCNGTLFPIEASASRSMLVLEDPQSASQPPIRRRWWR